MILRCQDRGRLGFTLLELMTVLVVITILFVMAVGVFSDMRTRAEKIHCTVNLKNLYTGVESYRQDQGHWPQIDPQLISTNDKDFYNQWIAALKPYGFGLPNWICKTSQRALDNPDMADPENVRIDYLPMPFDDNPLTPHRWPTQPWFIERGAVHPGGNLMIFTNGQIVSMEDVYLSRQ